MDVLTILSDNVRAMRERKKLTLDAAAELTGVSRSMLAQIEKGDVNPTISVLWKIANGYKVSFTALIERQNNTVTVIRGAELLPLTEDGGKYLNYPAFPFDEEKLFETYRIVIQPGGTLSAQPHLVGTEEYITIFSGEVEIGVDGTLHRLSRGDSIHFYADTEHRYHNPGAQDAELSMLTYYRKA